MTPPTVRTRRRIARGAPALLAGALLALLPHAAFAQSQDEAGARALFNEGRQLVKAGHYDEACGKFDAARKLYTSAGILLNLADCHERINRTASAWTEFGDAADTATRDGRAGDAVEAKRRQAALQGRLSLLAIVFEHAPDGAIVHRDGTLVDRAASGTPIPVDPGVHSVTVEASGYRPWTTKVTVTEPGKTVTTQVPELEAVAPASTPVAPSSPESPPSTPAPRAAGTTTAPPPSGQRVAGWTVGGVGVAAMAASGVLAIVARTKYSSAEASDAAGRHDDSVQAGRLADIATAALAIGAVTTVTGVVLLVTAPKAQITVGTTGTTLLLSGRF